jgi:hypothetical protein
MRWITDDANILKHERLQTAVGTEECQVVDNLYGAQQHRTKPYHTR